MYSANYHDKWLTIYKADAKKIGIEINLRFLDWSAAIKRIDEFKFEAFVLGWGGNPTPEPRQLWHGAHANKVGTSNLSGLAVKSIDELIDLTPTLFNEKERIEKFKKIEKQIIENQPYIFRWSMKNHLIAYWKDRVKPVGKPLYKFSGTIRRQPFYLHWQSSVQ